MEHAYDTPDPAGLPAEGSATEAKSTSSWPARVTRVVAAQVRIWRERRGLSAQQLSERTRELGYQVPRSVIANLENDRRDTIAVAELLILAAALDVPPTMLVTAVGEEESVEILPSIEVSPWKGRGWILGARHPTYKSLSLANWEESRRAIVLYDIHRMLVNEHHQIQNRIKRLTDHNQLQVDLVSALLNSSQQRRDMLTHAVQELVYSLDRLREHRNLIRAEGFLAPELPPALAVMLRESEPERRHRLATDTAANELRRPQDDEVIPPFLFDLIRSTMHPRPGPSSGEQSTS